MQPLIAISLVVVLQAAAPPIAHARQDEAPAASSAVVLPAGGPARSAGSSFDKLRTNGAVEGLFAPERLAAVVGRDAEPIARQTAQPPPPPEHTGPPTSSLIPP